MKYGKIAIAVVLTIVLTALLLFQFGILAGNISLPNPVVQQATADNTVKAANFVVAAANSSTEEKQQADYICDGVDDQVEINAAINALPDGGGKVLLLEGIYIISDSILPLSGTSLVGVGPETIIKLMDALPDLKKEWGMIGSFDTERTNIHIANLTLDGNRNNQTTAVIHYGVNFHWVKHWSIESSVLKNMKDYAIKAENGASYGLVANNVFVSNGWPILMNHQSNHIVIIGNTFGQGPLEVLGEQSVQYSSGIIVRVSYGTIIFGNEFYFSGVVMRSPAIQFHRGSIEGVIANNLLVGNGWNYGIFIYGADTDQDERYHSIYNNIIKGFEVGIVIRTEPDSEASDNTIIGNTIIENYKGGIYLSGNAHHNLISGNYIAGNSQTLNIGFDGIHLAGNSDYNTIARNTLRQGNLANKPRYGINILSSSSDNNVVEDNDLYSSGVSGEFNNAGTGTIFQEGAKRNALIAANFVIAAANSSAEDKQKADYVCDGTDDQIEINAAINALPDGGGKVLLLEGTYIISDSILPLSGTSLVGVGPETIIKLRDNLPDPGEDIHGYPDWGMIESLRVEKSNIHIANLTIDGNRNNQAAGELHGLYYTGVSYWSVASVVFKDVKTHAIKPYVDNPYGVIFDNTFINNGLAAYIDNRSDHTVFVGNTLKQNQSGILVDNCEGVVISGNTFDFAGVEMIGSAITFARGSERCFVFNNTLEGNGQYGVFLVGTGTNQDARYHSVYNNTIKGFSKGIVIGADADSEASYNRIVGNLIIQNSEEGIYLRDNAHHNLISGNYLEGNSQALNNSYDHILLAGNSDYNIIVGNTLRRGTQANKPRYDINISALPSEGNVVRDNDLSD